MCDECTWHHKTFLVQYVLTLGSKVVLYYFDFFFLLVETCFVKTNGVGIVVARLYIFSSFKTIIMQNRHQYKV